MTSSTWNPADKNARITLSGANLVATCDASGITQSVRATDYKSSGKHYYEVLFGGMTTGLQSTYIGVSTSGGSIADNRSVGDTTGGWSIRPANFGSSTLFKEGVNSGGYGADWTTGDVISVLLDLDAGSLEFWKNGVSQGVAVASGITGALAPMVTGVSSNVLTGAFKTSGFAYAPPAGYAGWNDGTGEGDVTLSQLTATGYEPGGGGTMALLTATGEGPPWGAVTMELLTATGIGVGETRGAVTMELLTASGVLENNDSYGTLTFEFPTGAGIADSNNAATGAVVTEKLTSVAYTPVAGAPTIELITAVGQSDSGQSASGALVLLPTTAAALAISQGDAAGTPLLQVMFALASAQNAGAADGAATMRRVRAIAAGIGGQSGAGAAQAKRPSAAGVGYTEATSSGAIIVPRLTSYASGEPALTAALDAWAMNVRTNAVTRYPSYPANSYARYNGTYLAAGPSGLLALGGNENVDFDGSGISWTMRTGQLDDKKAALKRLTEVLMSVRYDGPVRLRVWKDDETYYDYSLPSQREDVLQQVRAKVGKGLRSRYYKIELSGVGTHIEMDSLQATMPETTRRIG